MPYVNPIPYLLSTQPPHQYQSFSKSKASPYITPSLHLFLFISIQTGSGLATYKLCSPRLYFLPQFCLPIHCLWFLSNVHLEDFPSLLFLTSFGSLTRLGLPIWKLSSPNYHFTFSSFISSSCSDHILVSLSSSSPCVPRD